MPSKTIENLSKVDLVDNYRPIGLPALRAATSLKPAVSRISRRADAIAPAFGELPDGFHWPQGLDD